MSNARLSFVILLVALLAVSIGANLYEYGRASSLSSEVNSQWSQVKLGYIVINGTVFNEATSSDVYGPGYADQGTFKLANVTFDYQNSCPNCNGSQGFVFAISYYGNASHPSWNATLRITMFLDGIHPLTREDFTQGTIPEVGVIWAHDGHFIFLVSQS